jgi:hypothetical protein
MLLPNRMATHAQNGIIMNRLAFHLALGALGAVGFTAQAQLQLGGSGYTQSFDSLDLGLPTGWSVRTGASSTTSGLSASFAASPYNWSGTAAGYHNYASSAGLSAGATSAAQLASANRALGVRQSGTLGDPGAAFVLEVAHTLGVRSLAFSFDFLVLDEEGRSATWTADYALGANPSSFASLGTFSRDTWGAQTEQFLLPPVVDNQPETLWIRLAALQATTGAGSRDCYALDNFQLAYVPVPEPGAWSSMAGLGLLAFAWSRSRRTSA